MKLTISKLSKKEIPTKSGNKAQISFNDNGRWYQAWAGNWNSSWKEGDEIDVEISERVYKKKDGSQGKSYMIKAPATARNFNSPISSEAIGVLKEILEVQKEILKAIQHNNEFI